MGIDADWQDDNTAVFLEHLVIQFYNLKHI